jgi:phage terminase small subunit
MPSLKNQRHELFCIEVAKGLSAEKAYVAAGFAPTSARANAATLKLRKGVKERIAELIERRFTVEERGVERAIAKLALTKEAVLGELAKLAFANMADYMTVGPDGQPSLNFKDLTRDQAAALVEVTVEEFKDGRSDKREVRRVKFKLADKQKSLEALGKHLGLFIERHEHGGVGAFSRMSDEELDTALQEQAQALGLPEEAVGKLIELRAERVSEREPEE